MGMMQVGFKQTVNLHIEEFVVMILALTFGAIDCLTVFKRSLRFT
jgi:hypothetical protein